MNSMENAPKERQIGCPFDRMFYAFMQVEESTEVEMARLGHESIVHSKQRGPLRYLDSLHSLHLFQVLIFGRRGGFDAQFSPLFSFLLTALFCLSIPSSRLLKLPYRALVVSKNGHYGSHILNLLFHYLESLSSSPR